VDIYLGPEFKPLTEVLDPSWKDDTSSVAPCVVPLPLGMVLEESETMPGKIEVTEVVPGSNAEKAGVRPGDLLRGVTGMGQNVQQDSEEDFGFSVGLSEGKRVRAYMPTDKRDFDAVMGALKSNAVDAGGAGEATLIMERRVKSPATAS